MSARSAASRILRARIYDALSTAGLDVARLVSDARAQLANELAERAEKAAKKAGAKPPAPHSAPTRELVRHMGERPVVEETAAGNQPLSAPRSRWPWQIDAVSVALTVEEYQAASRLRAAFFGRTNHAKVADWNGAGGGSPGSRLPISDLQLSASRDWNALWTRLPTGARLIVWNFVLQQPPKGRAAPLTAEEFGKLYGSTTDPRRARGVTDGAVKCALAVLADLAADYDAWKREQRAKAAGQPPRPPRLTEDERATIEGRERQRRKA